MNTIIAIWDNRTKQLASVKTMMIHQAMRLVQEQAAGCPMDALPADSEWWKLFNELIQEQMENVPEKIYLDLGRNCPNDCDFSELSQVTWSQDNATGNGIEFTRSDTAEQQTVNAVIAFANWYDERTSTEESQNEPWMNEMNAKSFLSYYNSRKAQKAEE